MPPCTSFGSCANGSYGEIDVIGNDDEVLGLDVIAMHECGDGFAGEIHVRLRFCEDELLFFGVYFGNFREKIRFYLPICSICFSRLFYCKKTHIVAGFFVFFFWVSDTNDEKHVRIFWIKLFYRRNYFFDKREFFSCWRIAFFANFCLYIPAQYSNRYELALGYLQVRLRPTMDSRMSLPINNRFPVRFTVELGAHPTLPALVAVIEASGGCVSGWVRKLFPQITISPRKVVKVVTPTVEELGFTAELTSVRDIHARGIALGYELVPSDLAFSLRAQYMDQPLDEAIFMAMEALEHPDGYPVFLCVERPPPRRDRSVYAEYGRPEELYRLDHQFAFVDPSV